jgi:hypothetical protein
VLKSLVESLDDLLIVAASAAGALWFAAQRGIDLSAVLPQLKAALDHPEFHVRWQISRCVSVSLRNLGAEAPIPVHRGLQSNAWWTATVWHRRTYAADDESDCKRDLPNDIRPCVTIQCGRCRSKAARWIYSADDSGVGWTGHLVEVRCERCGKYTCWAYSDD